MEKTQLLLALILFSISTNLQAFDYSEDVNELMKYMKNVTTVIKKGNRSDDNRGNSCVKEAMELENIKENKSLKEKKEDEILVFVSFSMPEASLKQLSEESEKYNARLVMRGIYKNSFRKLKDKILSISDQGLKFDIDPELFKKYDIKQVPAFVDTKTGNRLSGNVTLEFATKKLMNSV